MTTSSKNETSKPRPSPIPRGEGGATPSFSARNAASAIDFYKRAFGAVETLRLDEPSGRVGHAELSIGEARFMLADEYPELGFVGPETLGGTTFTIHIYVEDVDALAARAVAAGATLEKPLSDEFYGDRIARIKDPFGHRWHFATRIEDVSAEEMKRRMAAMSGG